MRTIVIHPGDAVGVALSPLEKGEQAEGVILAEDIPQGHKFALRPIAKGEEVIKYGYSIGLATQDIPVGAWVHTHNVRTGLAESDAYHYAPEYKPLTPVAPESFQGYLRKDGRAAIRNEVWILPMVGCVNDIAEALARGSNDLAKSKGMDGVFAYGHPYGCSQIADDLRQTQKLLAALAKHPHAGGVLVLALGCENNTLESFQALLGDWDAERVRFLVCQDVEDEMEEGARILAELIDYAAKEERQPLPVSKLLVGLKCGGSDGLSGITANPVAGAFSDMLIAQGGSAILTEVPEMFGAETILMNRAVSEEVFEKCVAMIQNFKKYFVSYGQPVYENPSPGNKDGGLTTLEDKSLGCVQKGGSAPVVDVIDYAGQASAQGLSLLYGPGNDLVSVTALAAAGVHAIYFTTGRGTPFAAPVPTVKLSTNTALAEKKPGWIDFNAGTVAQGEAIADAARRLFDYTLALASGEIRTRAEEAGYRGIAIFKDGVTV